MIPMLRSDVYEVALRSLTEFGRQNQIRGRFIALLLGLKRMGTDLAALGDARVTPAAEIERFLDDLYTKSHVPEPFVVLTAPFGGSTSPSAPYSSRSAVTAPGHRYSTNTWRNNFGIQKGVGCPADPATIEGLLTQPTVRLACPHMQATDGQYRCGLAGTTYRGEEHSIWLRQAPGGYQVVDLNAPLAYMPYLRTETAIPIFALIAVLYGMSGPAFPIREVVGIPEFAEDFSFSLEQVQDLFDCDPDSPWNARILEAVSGEALTRGMRERLGTPYAPRPSVDGAGPMPVEVPAATLNSGVGAEVAVALELATQGWDVGYRGNQRGIGYDLEATRGEAVLRVEVKSSVAFANIELLPTEWEAAQRHGDEFVIAAVDFYGSPAQSIWYVRNPAAIATPRERPITVYQFDRVQLLPIRTEAEFL